MEVVMREIRDELVIHNSRAKKKHYVRFDSQGELLRTLEGPAKVGVQRIAWDLRGEPIPKPKDKGGFEFEMSAPLVLPGTYTIKLKVEDEEMTAPVEVRLKPGLDVSDQDLKAQHDTLARLHESAVRGVEAVRDLDHIKPQLEQLNKGLKDMENAPEDIVKAGEEILERLDAVRFGSPHRYH